MAQTVADLGKLVKTKYPGSYDDMPDDQVGVAVKQRFPGAYEDFESPVKGSGSFDTADPFAKVARSARPSTAVGQYTPAPAPAPAASVPGMERLGGTPPGPPKPPLPQTWESQDTPSLIDRVQRGLQPPKPVVNWINSHTPNVGQPTKAYIPPLPVQAADWTSQKLAGGAQAGARGVERMANPVRQTLHDVGRQKMQEMGVPPAQIPPAQVNKETFPEMAAGATEVGRGLMQAAEPSLIIPAITNPFGLAATLGAGMGTEAVARKGLEAAGVDPRVAGAVSMAAGLAAAPVAHEAISRASSPGGAVNSRATHEEYGQDGTPGTLAGPPPVPTPRAYPGVPPARPMPGQPLPGPRPVKSALDSAKVFQDDAMRQERRDSIPGPQPVKPAAESAEAFGPDVKVTGLLDLQNQIAKRLAGVEYGQLEAADRGAVDKLALEEQGKLKAQRAAQKAPVAPEPETGPPAPVEQAPAPEPPPTGERPGMWPPPVDMTNQRVPAPAPIEQVGDEGLARVAQIEAQGPKRAAATQELQKRGAPGPPPVRMEPMPGAAKQSAEVFRNAPPSIAERAEAFDDLPEPEPQKTSPLPASPQPGAVQKFLSGEEGFQRIPTKQDLIDVKNDALNKWDGFQRGFREHATDRFAPISDLLKKATAPIPADDSAYVGARNYSGIGGRAEVRLDRLGKILRAADRDKLVQPMINYALYERYEELSDRSIDRFPNGQTIHQIRTDKANLERDLGPANLVKVQRYVGQIRDYSNSLMKEALDGGVISKEQYNAMLANNQKFIPLHRLAYLMDEIANGNGGNSNAFSLRGHDLYHNIKGSESEIVDPVTSIIRNTYKTVSTVARNKVAQQIGDLASRPEFKGIVDEMKPGQSVPPGKEMISALRDGKRVDYVVPKDVGRALKGMNSQQVDIVTKAASKMGSMLRAGATSLNVAFLASNVVRDYQTATAVSKVGFTPVDWANGFWQAVAAKTGLFDDAIYKAYEESGGSMSGYFGGAKDLARTREDLTDGFVKKEILPDWKNRRLGAAGKAAAGAAIGGVVGGPAGAAVGAGTGLVLHTVTHLGELTELAPRLGVFMKSLDQGKSLTEAGFNSRNATVDFSKSGNTLRMLNMWVPFLNARLQGNINLFQAMRPSQVGSRQMFGAARGSGKVAAWNMLKAGTMVGIPAIATYLYNHRDEATKKVWDSIKDYEKRNNFIVIMGDHQDEEGYYTQAIKIPKGDVKAFANPIESALEYQLGVNPKSLARLAVEFSSDISPVDFEQGGKIDAGQLANEIPPTLKGGLEGLTNMNFYTGRRIEPEEIQKASPENRYTNRTSNLARVIGGKVGVGPMKVDNFAHTQFGGLGGQIMAMSGSDKTPAGFGPALKQVQRRYLGARGGAEDDRARETLGNVDMKYADASLDRSRSAEDIADKLDAMKPGERSAFVQQMIASGKMDDGLADAVTRSIEGRRMGLTPIERSLKSRPLAVRAEYIAQELKAAPTAERKTEIIRRYAEKNILTDNVAEMVAEMLAGGASAPARQ